MNVKHPITIEEIVENEDGSASVHCFLSNEATSILIREGFRELIGESEVVVIPAKKGQFPRAIKQYELTDEEAQTLLQLGFIQSLRVGMKILK